MNNSASERVYLPARQVRERYGGRSHMWIVRRLADDPDFPRPIYFGRLRFWDLEALKAWERKCALKKEAA